jgi:hypothetical protein
MSSSCRLVELSFPLSVVSEGVKTSMCPCHYRRRRRGLEDQMVANMNDEETARLEAFLAPPRIAVLVTLHGSGSPADIAYLVPVL